MEQAFAIGEALSFAWTKVKEQLGFFIGFSFIIFVIQGLNGVIQKFFENNNESFLFVLPFILLSIIIGVVIGLFQIRIALDVADSKKATLGSLKSTLPLFGKAFVTQLLYTLIIIVGFFLLVIPGIIWTIKYQYALYFIVDKNMSPFEALEASGKVTKGEKWHLFLFNLVLGLVVFAGLLAFGIGLLIAIPIAMVAPGFVFRQLQKHSAAPIDPTITSATPSTPSEPS